MIEEQIPKASLGWLFSYNMDYPMRTIMLGVVVSSVIFYSLHQKASELVINNFQGNDPWIAEAELVLLTGGSSGIGKQLMEDLARKGLHIVMLDINPPPFTLPRGAYFYEADITSAKVISEVATRIRASHGDPTILINNAGIFHHGCIIDKPEHEIRQTFEVNTVAHFLLLKEFLPALIRANRGHIVTVASAASFVAVGEMVDYCCSKASALAFHEGLRQELKYWYRAPNVRTSIVHPLWVETPMIKGFTDHRATFGQPTMGPAVVSEAVLDHILSRKSGQIILPRALSLAGSLRALPLWLQEAIRSFSSKIVRRVSDVRAIDKVQAGS